MPNSPISINDKQQADIDKILDKLEDDEDVQKIFTNIALTSNINWRKI